MVVLEHKYLHCTLSTIDSKLYTRRAIPIMIKKYRSAKPLADLVKNAVKYTPCKPLFLAKVWQDRLVHGKIWDPTVREICSE